MAGVRITAYQDEPFDGWVPANVGSALSDMTGSYDLGALPAGTYRIGFRDTSGAHAVEYFDDVTTVEAATDVVVAAGATVPDQDAQLEVSSRITGRVTGSGGAALTGISVAAFERDPASSSWRFVGNTATTNAAGDYELSGLRAGTYRIAFLNFFGGSDYQTEYYDDAPTIDTATDIVLGAATTVAGKNAQLALAEVPPEYEPSVLPSVSGTTKVGDVLTATSGVWSPTGATFGYQWLADGVDVPGATSSTLLLTESLVGKGMSVRVTATGPDAEQGSAVSNTVGPVQVATTPTPDPDPDPDPTPTADADPDADADHADRRADRGAHRHPDTGTRDCADAAPCGRAPGRRDDAACGDRT